MDMLKDFQNLEIVPILLFMGDYIGKDPMVILKSVLSEGYDVVLN